MIDKKFLQAIIIVFLFMFLYQGMVAKFYPQKPQEAQTQKILPQQIETRPKDKIATLTSISDRVKPFSCLLKEEERYAVDFALISILSSLLKIEISAFNLSWQSLSSKFVILLV